MTTKRIRVLRSAPPSKAAKDAIVKAKAAERERAFLANLKALGVPVPIPELRFHPVRKFRWDYAWGGAERLAVEVDGGIWTRGAHGRGTGITRDHEKQNLGATMGWRVLRCTPRQLADPAFAATVRDALAGTP